MLRILSGAGALTAVLATASYVNASTRGSEADQLLNRLRTTAHTTQSDADHLALMDRHVSWRTAVGVLDQIKLDINSMAPAMLKLESLQAEATPVQLKEIESARALLETMASDTNTAINTLNNNTENYASVPGFVHSAGDLSAKSGQLSHSLNEYFALARGRSKEQRLKKDMGVTGE
jgi:hypothetical protein